MERSRILYKIHPIVIYRETKNPKKRLGFQTLGAFVLMALSTLLILKHVYTVPEAPVPHNITEKLFRVCIQESERGICNQLERDGSQAICSLVESRVDCAIRLARGAADFGMFSEEETLLLAQQQPNDHRVVATIRDVSRLDPFAFEAVAVVPNSHTGGLEGLRGGRYCHPGFDKSDLRWSPRVLRTLEQAAARTDRCQGFDTARKSADELEVETLNAFFGSACRPGPWSANSTVDEALKRRFPNLCALCGTNNTCTGYTINMGVGIAGVSNDNRHIQALECMRSNGNGSVAYVAWQHVRDYFTIRSPDLTTSFALLCEDGSTQTLTAELLSGSSSPCAFVRQPWGTVLASTSNAATVRDNMRSWWPEGSNPGAGTWQGVLFNSLVGGGANPRIVIEDTLISPLNYTSTIRNITSIDSTPSCLPATRWCTLSALEQNKCNWVRTAAYTLGIQPYISCQQRTDIFACLRDIRDNQADFIASSSNYGYLARQHYQLSPVKLVQNSRSAANAFSRVAAFVLETSAQGSITRFENLRGKRACFPEYGGIAYVAFVRTAHERGIIRSSECDYARAVGEFFDGACAPGAIDASHALSSTDFNATTLCTVCRPAAPTAGNVSDFTCAWDFSNMFFANNGSLACLADPTTDVAVLQTQNIQAHLNQLNMQPNQLRALCRNNTLAATTGVNVDESCLLAHVVDAEVVTRRNDPLLNAINVLLDTIELFFGYTAEAGGQLINLEIFSPFDDVSDLLFKDTAIGLSEPTLHTANQQARNYIELFQHLETCTGAAAPGPGVPGPAGGFASRNFYSLITLVVMSLITRFVVY